MRFLFAALLALASPAALAQTGPSFDCAKAATEVERAICQDPELAKADRELTAAYTALFARLTGYARDVLAADQLRWLRERNRGCATDTDGIVPCLKQRYATRTANLRVFADGAYPFVSEMWLVKSGTLDRITWSYEISYPRFDSPYADFSAINARFAATARKAANEATPKPDSMPERKQEWTHTQSFKVFRPNADAVTVAVDFYGYSGGAHGYGATDCTLVDLRTGKAAGPAEVFAAGDPWLKSLVGLVGADLKKQFVDKPGFEDALRPANLRKTLSEPGHYCWRSERLELIFNAYEVGPYAAGPYEVYIPYESLKPLLRADGPIGR